ncbi:hypothetical protein CERSUDRAFT_107937 [Gelatoporia subvermispora B]|uniref:NADP-dependent oxidoreductase domain-containing protein n=1 Tax=Ceriporiopsis subvermispora (strain B) TaxID=914234 RepID=M2Q9P1_CERS8|nr:hypothetical protein CERSUDRAFT_107937 [Gelatoporia subvermispora B]
MAIGEAGKEGVRTPALVDCQRVVDAFVKHGFREIDTGRVYGEGTPEAYLAQLDLGGSAVDTKVFPVRPGDHSAQKLRESSETSHKTLVPHKIRTLYLHKPDEATPYEETLRAINDLYKEGVLSVAEIATICRINGWVRPVVYEGMYNAITRGIERELVPCCRKHGLRIVAYNPLAGGFFAGKVSSPDADVPRDERFSPHTAVGQIYRNMYIKQGYFEALDHLKPFAEKHDLRLTEIDIRWLQHHSCLTPNDGIIIGVSSAAQMEQNCQDAAKGPLPQVILQALGEATKMVQPFEPSYWQYLDITKQEMTEQ